MPVTTSIIRGLSRPTRSRLFLFKPSPRTPYHQLSPFPSRSITTPSILTNNRTNSTTTSNNTLSTQAQQHQQQQQHQENSHNNPQPPWPWLGHPLRVLLSSLKFIALAHLIWEYVISLAPAEGPSMLPTFEVVGEYMLISKLHRFGRGVSVGDIVTYNIPVSEDAVGVKRVLGMPGDYVLMETPGHGTGGMIQVPPGHCWIVGDNLVASKDSRYFGPVPLALIRGKVIAAIRPSLEFRWIENPLKKVEED